MIVDERTDGGSTSSARTVSTGTTMQPVKRDWRGFGIAAPLSLLACLIGLMSLAWAVLFVTHGRFLRHRFESVLGDVLHRNVRVEGRFELYLDPINIKFVADDMSVSNPEWASKAYFFQAKHIETRISTIRLLLGERHARWLDLDTAAVDMEWDKPHLHNSWTFGDPKKKGAPFQFPVIDSAKATGTTLRYRDHQLLLATDQRFDTVQSSAASIANAICFSGTGTLRGKPFTNSGALLSPNTTVRLGRTQLVLHADQGPTHLDLSGTLPAATQIENSDLNLIVHGPNLRLLFDLLGVAVADSRRYQFHSRLTKVDGEWRFSKLAGYFGDSDLAGSMRISQPNGRLDLNADLASRTADILDVGPLLGYDPQRLASTGAVAAATTHGRRDHPRLFPDAPLRVEALKAFDAHVTYRAATVRAPHLPVSNVALVFDLDHNLLKLSPLTMDLAGGHLASDITLDARRPAVSTTYDIRLSATPLNGLLSGFGVASSGVTGTITGHIALNGTGDSVRKSLASSNGRIAIVIPAGTLWTRNAQLSEFDIGVFLQRLLQRQSKAPIQINCGLVAFTVKDGIAAADPILIDTAENVMVAKGGFNFADESLNLQFRANAKKFSAFSGQSPVGISGYFAAPRLQIVTPQLLGRAAAAVALGVVATPAAAVLVFVDPGRARATACGPVLSADTAAQQHTTQGKSIGALGGSGENKQKGATSHKRFLGIF